MYTICTESIFFFLELEQTGRTDRLNYFSINFSFAISLLNAKHFSIKRDKGVRVKTLSNDVTVSKCTIYLYNIIVRAKMPVL